MKWSRETVRQRGWWFGALGGLVFAVAVGLGTQAYQEQREAQDRRAVIGTATDDVPGPVDMVRDLLAQDEQIVVHPDVADRIDPEYLERARVLLADAPPGLARHIAYAPGAVGDLDAGYTRSGAMAQWMAGLGEEGHYVMMFDDGRGEIETIGVESEYLSDGSDKGQPGPVLVRVAEQVAAWGDGEEYSASGEYDEWGGPVDGVMAGLMLGAFTIVPFFFLLRWFVGRRRFKEF